MYKTKIYFWNKRAKEKNIHLPSFFKDMILSNFYPSYLPFQNKSLMILLFFPNNNTVFKFHSLFFKNIKVILEFIIKVLRYIKRKLPYE